MNSASGSLANRMEVAADGNTTFEQTSITTPHSGSTYTLSGTFAGSQSKWNVAVFSFDGDMDDAEIHVNFCGNDVILGIINKTITKYTIDIECGSATGDVTIFHSINNTAQWKLSSASIKEITLNVNANANEKVNYGDVLQIDTEDFLVIGTNASSNQDKILVKPGHGGTTKAAHSSTTSVNAYKAVFEQLSSTSISTATPAFITKDFDFGDPSRVKKIYKIYITYMNSASGSLANRMEVAADGNTTFEQTSITTPHSGSTYTLSGTFAGSQSKWNVAVFSFDSPFPCQSIALYFNPDSIANGLSINDISFEYRSIHKRVS